MVFNFSKTTSDERDKFVFGSFWADDNCRELYVTNINDVILAVKKAYIDMTPRTIDGLGLSENKISKDTKKLQKYKDLVSKKSKLINNLKLNLAKNIVEKVFKKNKFDDKTHEELCDDFINDFKSIRDDLNKEISEIKKVDTGIEKIDKDDNKITYGKAQKIVNMSMKYLYFFDDANNYVSTVFNKCHMAIDEYIMKFFDSKGYKRKVDRWSNFDKKTYNDYRTKVVNDCCSGDGKLPFFAEFDYWNQGRKLP